MIEVNDRRMAALSEDSVFPGPRGSEEGQGRAEGNGKWAEAAASGREASIPDPEVQARPRRRRFSAAHKARVAAKEETEPDKTPCIVLT